MTDQEFSDLADRTLTDLEDRLNEASADLDMEVEAEGGTIKLLFDDPHPGTFVLSANPPAKQIWLSALSTSFKFNWSEEKDTFVHEKSGESISSLIARLISEQIGFTRIVTL
ncbi:MAG: iron donor protein CyaY [Acidobacteriia bacterium]|nr:iron donor protein CyaY [Terriglobia bacterium]